MEISANTTPGAVLTQLAPGVLFPSPTIATGRVGEFNVALMINVQPSADGPDGALACTSLTLQQRPGGPAVTGTALRAIPVAQLLRAAGEQVIVRTAEPAFNYTQGTIDHGGTVAVTLTDTGTATDALTVTVNDSPDGADYDPALIRLQGPTDANLRLVARLYREGLAVSRRPTAYVEKHLRLPRSTTGDWIRLARQRGYLPPSAGRGKVAG